MATGFYLQARLSLIDNAESSYEAMYILPKPLTKERMQRLSACKMKPCMVWTMSARESLVTSWDISMLQSSTFPPAFFPVSLGIWPVHFADFIHKFSTTEVWKLKTEFQIETRLHSSLLQKKGKENYGSSKPFLFVTPAELLHG